MSFVARYFVSNEKMVGHWINFYFWLNWLIDFSNKGRKEFFKIIHPFTMVSYRRLINVWNLVDEVERKSIKGNLVECGVWKGGCAAIMAYLNQTKGNIRKVYLFDSFEGMPEPSKEDEEKAWIFSDGKNGGELKSINKSVGTQEEVERLLFTKLKLKRKNIILCKGWFQQTLKHNKANIGQIAILRIDADWYESVRVCLDELYDQVVKGGYIIFDDYGWWPGCKKAVDEFIKRKKLKISLQKIDPSGVYFVK